MRAGLYGNANIAFKIKLGVAGYLLLTSQIANHSFISSGIWPMGFKFFENLRRSLNKKVRTSSTNSEGSLESLRMTKQTSDDVLYSRIKAISQKEKCATQDICMIEQALQENHTMHRILWEGAPLEAPVQSAQKSSVNASGDLAAVLTDKVLLSDIINARSIMGTGKYNVSDIGALDVERRPGSSVGCENYVLDAEQDIPIMLAWRRRQFLSRCRRKKNEPVPSAADALLDLAKGR